MEDLILCKSNNGNHLHIPSTQLVLRNAAYGIILERDDVLVCETDVGLTLPGGRIELGEDHLTGLIREMKEETGFDVHNPRLVDCQTTFWTHSGKGYHCLNLFYVCERYAGSLDQIELDPVERGWNQRPTWISLHDAYKRGFGHTADIKRVLDLATSLTPL